MRADYIEADYVGGVTGDDGDIVIRPLNEEEKDFLNKFYEEEVSANFHHNKETKRLFREIKKIERMESPTDADLSRWEKLKAEYYINQDKVLLNKSPEEQRKAYGANNARNRCIYNRSKASRKLGSIEDRDFIEDSTQVCLEKDTNPKIVKDDITKEREYIVRKRKEKREKRISKSKLLFGDKK